MVLDFLVLMGEVREDFRRGVGVWNLNLEFWAGYWDMGNPIAMGDDCTLPFCTNVRWTMTRWKCYAKGRSKDGMMPYQVYPISTYLEQRCVDWKQSDFPLLGMCRLGRLDGSSS